MVTLLPEKKILRQEGYHTHNALSCYIHTTQTHVTPARNGEQPHPCTHILSTNKYGHTLPCPCHTADSLAPCLILKIRQAFRNSCPKATLPHSLYALTICPTTYIYDVVCSGIYSLRHSSSIQTVFSMLILSGTYQLCDFILFS